MAITVHGQPRMKSYFFRRTSQGAQRGTRFVTDDRPIEEVFRDLVENVTFKTQQEDRALLDDVSSDLFDKAGLVVAATSDQVKTFLTMPSDRTFVVMPNQVPESVEEAQDIILTDQVLPSYNSGEPIDLSEDSGDYDNSGDLSNWWRMGDGDTYPTIEDNVGSIDCTMTNMVSGDIVSVVPSA